jgi:hypothetical protein
MTNENVSYGLLEKLGQLDKSIENIEAKSNAYQFRIGGDDVMPSDMDLTTYRLDQAEKRAEISDARMERIEAQLTQIQVALAGLATKDSIRNWGIAVVAIVVATAVGLGALLMQSSSNQLSAFQAGLSAIQAVSSAQTLPNRPAQKN